MSIFDWGASPDPENAWPYAAYLNDDLFFGDHHVMSASIVSKWMRIKDVIGIPSILKGIDHRPTFYTGKPTRYSWDGRSDYDRYGSLLTNLESLAHSCASSRYSQLKAIGHERTIEHVAYKGHLIDSSLVSCFKYDGMLSDMPFYFDTYSPSVSSVGSFLVDISKKELKFAPQGPVEGHSHAGFGQDLFERFDRIVGTINVLGGSYTRNYYGFTYTYSNVSNNSSRDLGIIDVEYDYEMTNVYLHRVKYHVHIFAEVSFRPTSVVDGIFDSGRYYNIQDDVLSIVDHSKVEYVDSNWTGFIPLIPTLHGQLALSRSIVVSDYNPSTAGESIDLGFYDFIGESKTRNGSLITMSKEAYLRNRFHLDLKDIRSSSFLAASDALTQLTSVLDANWLQNAQHLGDILSVLPDVKGLSEILAKFNDGDISLLKDIADYLTDGILRWNFQQKPLIRDGKEILQKDLLTAVRRLSQPRTYRLHGKFEYTFEEKDRYFLGYEQTLVTRAEIEIQISLGSLLTACLIGDSLGFFPTLSRLWSLVPFSFVVDWFTNMSARLAEVDSQIKFLGCTTNWCVYSYKVAVIPSVSDLDDYGLIDCGRQESLVDTFISDDDYNAEGPFQLTVYRRELSLIMPRLTDSRFDFLKRVSGPNPWTVGSLLWKLI